MNDFYRKFRNYLLTCIERWMSNSIFAPICILYQGSGHGKSRCMKQFSENHLSVYICLGSKNENTYPKKSDISYLFLSSMAEQESANNFLFNLVDKTLDFIHDIKTTKPKSVLIDEFNSIQYFNIDQGRNSETNRRFFDLITSTQGQFSNIIQMNQHVSRKMYSYLKEIPLFFFIDEANHLLEKSNCQESLKFLSKYQILRRTSQTLFKNVRIAFVG